LQGGEVSQGVSNKLSYLHKVQDGTEHVSLGFVGFVVQEWTHPAGIIIDSLLGWPTELPFSQPCADSDCTRQVSGL
jgi:hypothetical protein